MDHPFTAVFGSEPKQPLIKDMLNYYDNLQDYKFSFENNNTISVSDLLINKYGCKKDNKYQIIKNNIAVYPDYIFCNPSKKSVTIHIFTGTWLEKAKPIKRKIATYLKLKLNKRWKANIYSKLFR